MAQIAKVQFVKWDKFFLAVLPSFNVMVGDYVMLNLKNGIDLGKIISIEDAPATEPSNNSTEEKLNIFKKADQTDMDKLSLQNKNKEENFKYCFEAIKRMNLPMKLVDVHFSYDGRRVTFAFIANGRIDFRDLVKDLTHKFQKMVRLHQIGVRDEARLKSDVGSCGRRTCCTAYLQELGNVNSDFAELQQISHRGSERLSGVCGRLHCCLNYEQNVYEQLIKKLPTVGTKIKLKDGAGATVVSLHTLKQTIDVQIEGSDTVVEIDLDKIVKS